MAICLKLASFIFKWKIDWKSLMGMILFDFGFFPIKSAPKRSIYNYSRYFTCFEIYVCWPLILKMIFFVICFLNNRNMIIWVLSTLSDILLALSLWTISFNLWFIYLFNFFMEVLEYKRFLSSSKWCISEGWITLLIIYIYHE